MRAYFRAYRTRINDLEEEVENMSYSLSEASSCQDRMSRDLRNARSTFEDELKNEQYERWSLEDRVKKLERA